MKKKAGAAANNPGLDVQLVTSGGMQLLSGSIAAQPRGAIFNSDGCDPILDNYGSGGVPVIEGSGIFKQITCGVYASSAQNMVGVESDGHKYYSHSQLAFRYGSGQIGGYDNALGIFNKKGRTFGRGDSNGTLDSYAAPKVIEVPGVGGARLFAAGLGYLHVYEATG